MDGLLEWSRALRFAVALTYVGIGVCAVLLGRVEGAALFVTMGGVVTVLAARRHDHPMNLGEVMWVGTAVLLGFWLLAHVLYALWPGLWRM
ncbi:hypothetical protein [Deinococcus pimensis]|uniref:hypothetical protein n=1 Tax=Deinococcus pimensis TaxID=309888 RepID=UPI0004B9FDB7|nr:hypothetical protein [Deinococcus pimensis]